jgi:small nuclear ribonucleoprotein (snRNP)-like protein
MKCQNETVTVELKNGKQRVSFLSLLGFDRVVV